MWSVGAQIVFLLLMTIIYHRIIQATLSYGQKLRNLRLTCGLAMQQLEKGETPPDDDSILMVREKDTQKIVYEHNCASNQKELLRIMGDTHVKSETVIFKHIPDAENMSHIIGVYKDSNAKYECIACIDT